jgi:hypothetical protein
VKIVQKMSQAKVNTSKPNLKALTKMNLRLHRAIRNITSTTLKNEGLELKFDSSPKYAALGNI